MNVYMLTRLGLDYVGVMHRCMLGFGSSIKGPKVSSIRAPARAQRNCGALDRQAKMRSPIIYTYIYIFFMALQILSNLQLYQKQGLLFTSFQPKDRSL